MAFDNSEDNKKARREYGPEDHWMAASAILTASSEAGAARQAGIPVHTLRYWIKQDWFQEILGKIRQEHERVYLATAHSIVMKGMKRAIDALEKGESVIDKNGQERMRPVGAKDAAVIASMWMNHKRVMENKPTSISGSSNVKKLEDQKAMFEKMAKMTQKESDNHVQSNERLIPSPETSDAGNGGGGGVIGSEVSTGTDPSAPRDGATK